MSTASLHWLSISRTNMRALASLLQQTRLVHARAASHLLIPQPPRLAAFVGWHVPAATQGGAGGAAGLGVVRVTRAVASVAASADASSQAAPAPGDPLLLIIYSKPGCCLCDGLKEKVEALIDRAEFVPCALTGAALEVRDITSRPEWEAAYSMTIPVLAAARQDGSGEVVVPRPSPRLSADGLQNHIEKFLQQRVET